MQALKENRIRYVAVTNDSLVTAPITRPGIYEMTPDHADVAPTIDAHSPIAHFVLRHKDKDILIGSKF